MRKLIVLGALGAVLAGCTSPAYQFDRDAMPAAQRARMAGWQKCVAELTDGPAVTLIECHNENNRAFLRAIHYRDNGAFEAYFDRVRLLAIDADAGRITKDEFFKRLSQIFADHERLLTPQ